MAEEHTVSPEVTKMVELFAAICSGKEHKHVMKALMIALASEMIMHGLPQEKAMKMVKDWALDYYNAVQKEKK